MRSQLRWKWFFIALVVVYIVATFVLRETVMQDSYELELEEGREVQHTMRVRAGDRIEWSWRANASLEFTLKLKQPTGYKTLASYVTTGSEGDVRVESDGELMLIFDNPGERTVRGTLDLDWSDAQAGKWMLWSDIVLAVVLASWLGLDLVRTGFRRLRETDL